jgi:hypothetical protein
MYIPSKMIAVAPRVVYMIEVREPVKAVVDGSHDGSKSARRNDMSSAVWCVCGSFLTIYPSS